MPYDILKLSNDFQYMLSGGDHMLSRRAYGKTLVFFLLLIILFMMSAACKKEPLTPEAREAFRLAILEQKEDRWRNFSLEFYADTSTYVVEIILDPPSHKEVNEQIVDEYVEIVRAVKEKHIPKYRFIGKISQYQWKEGNDCCPELVVLKEFK